MISGGAGVDAAFFADHKHTLGVQLSFHDTFSGKTRIWLLLLTAKLIRAFESALHNIKQRWIYLRWNCDNTKPLTQNFSLKQQIIINSIKPSNAADFHRDANANKLRLLKYLQVQHKCRAPNYQQTRANGSVAASYTCFSIETFTAVMPILLHAKYAHNVGTKDVRRAHLLRRKLSIQRHLKRILAVMSIVTRPFRMFKRSQNNIAMLLHCNVKGAMEKAFVWKIS